MAEGSVKQVTIEDGETRIVAEYDRHSRVQKIREVKGVERALTEFEYGRFGIVKVVRSSGSGQTLATFEQTYNSDGRVTSSFENDASGRLVWKMLYDAIDDTPRALRRRILLQSASSSQLNESTRFIECRGRCTKTELISDGKTLATWTIYRDRQGRAVKDDVDYADLSFAYHQHRPDGSSFEHRFSSVDGKHLFVERNSKGLPISVLSSDGSGRTFRGTTQYNPQGRRSVERREELGVRTLPGASELRYNYQFDQSGNWTEQEIRSSQGPRTIRRIIEYRSHSHLN